MRKPALTYVPWVRACLARRTCTYCPARAVVLHAERPMCRAHSINRADVTALVEALIPLPAWVTVLADRARATLDPEQVEHVAEATDWLLAAAAVDAVAPTLVRLEDLNRDSITAYLAAAGVCVNPTT